MAIHEIMLVTPAIRNLIRESKSHQIHSVIDTSRGQGMQTMETAIQRALKQNMITKEEAENVRIKVGITTYNIVS